MNIFSKKILMSAAAVLMVSTSAWATLRPLPSDTAVHRGTLPNGLTYYVRANSEPAGQVDFYIAQRVGSVNETESQRGLAHFLEHMCFNGTRHFPGNSLIEYLQGLGVKFGANLNAYTSTDETVYNICAVPSQRPTALDSCLLILRDWSRDVTLDDKDIDEERGVIVGEWRQRHSQASNRLIERAAPRILAGSKYGNRLPIGLMSVVENFPTDTLRTFYDRWYHPVNQCVIVVGDINPRHVINEIERLWADVPLREDARFTPTQLPSNPKPIAVAVNDGEQPTPMLMLYIKHSDLPVDSALTIAGLRREVVSSLLTSMLADRLDEIESRADAPFTNLGIGDNTMMLVRSTPALLMRAVARPGRQAEAMSQWSTELKRAARLGFAQSELERAKTDFRADEDSRFATRNKVTNTEYARRYVRNYLDGGAMPDAVARHKMLRGVLASITTDEVTAYLRSIIRDDDANVTMLAYIPGTDSTANTSIEQSLVDAWTGVDTASLTPWVDKVVDAPLLAKQPKAGKIVKDTAGPYNSRRWKLSNGINVVLMPTDYNPDRVTIQGYSTGGFAAKYDPAMFANYKMANEIIGAGAFGEFNATALRKRLAGTNIKSVIAIDKNEETLGVGTTPASLETAFQVLYLKATGACKDSAAFTAAIENQRVKLEGNRNNITYAMGDSIHSNVFRDHPLERKLRAGDLKDVDYDKIMQLYHERFDDMGDFTFYIVGKFDIDSIRPLVCRYLASLPSGARAKQPEKEGDVGLGYVQGQVTKVLHHPAEVKQAICYTFYNNDSHWDINSMVAGRALGSVAGDMLRKELREARGWTYGVKTHIGIPSHINGDGREYFIMPVYVRVAPENAKETMDIVDSIVKSLCNPANISQDAVDQARSYMLKNWDEAQRDNGYWMSVLRGIDFYGQDLNADFPATVKAMTPQSLAEWAKSVIPTANRLQLTMMPD